MTKRPLFVIAVFLVLGEFLASWNGKMAFAWIAGICMPAVFFYYRRGGNIRQKAAGLVILLAGCAGCVMYLHADEPDSLQHRCEHADKPAEGRAEGYIERIEETGYGFRIFLKKADVWIDGEQWDEQGVVVTVSSAAGMKTGNRVGAEGKLKLFERATNPGEFDLYRYYRAEGYGYTMNSDEVVILDGRYDYIQEFLNRLRCKMKDNIYTLADEKDAGIFCAIFLGDKDSVDEEVRELYESQGIAHLLSVSGLHISMVGMVICHLLRRCTGSYGISGILGGGAVIMYGMLTGGSLSAIRAVIMYLVSLIAAWKGRIYDMQTSLAAAALIIVFQNPLVVSLTSFQLSFSAVLGLGMLTDIWKAFLLREDKTGMLPILGLQSMMLPALLYSFYQQPLFSMLLNQLALPLSGILLVCAAGCACLGGALPFAGKFMAEAGGMILNYYERLCQTFEQIPGGIIMNGRPEVWRIALYLLFLAGLAWGSSVYRERKKWNLSSEAVPKHWKKRFCLVHFMAVTVTCFAALFLRADPVRCLEVIMLDVGQGDCFLIRLPGGIDIMSDCGSSDEKKLAEYTVEPVLFSMGIDSLDAVILSHADEDHVNGLTGLLERGKIDVEQVLIPDYAGCIKDFAEVLEIARKAGSKCSLWAEGTSFKAGKAEFFCLHPFSNETYQDTNSASLTFRLTYGAFDMLFTGDIGIEQETEMEIRDIDVLKAAHHGSKYSSSVDWLEKVLPGAALISCGEGNSYGHPHRETLERFESIGADCYITAKMGAVWLKTDGEEFEISVFTQK